MGVDYIIAGQGIAGSMLAWFLLKAGKKPLIIDGFSPLSASRVASGIINPVTGKRLVKSWRIDELLPAAKKTYHELESELGVKFFSEKIICRIFSNREDAQFFRQKKELGELPHYVKPLKTIPACFHDSSLGGVEITKAYHLDYPVLLTAMRKFFRQRGMLREEVLQHDRLVLKNEKVSYNEIEAAKIIFCEGSKAAENPCFSRLPFNLAKGEMLMVRMPGFPQHCIWHQGVFILPLGNSLFNVGATYEWNFPDELPSQKGRKELTDKLSRAVNLPFEIVAHQAAIRPTVADRRPLIGMHPDFPQLGIFNGLGTKGASLAPFFAAQLTQYLTGSGSLDKEADIKRFMN